MPSDFKLLIFMYGEVIDCLDHSCYTPDRIAQSVVYRLHDPKIVGSILDSAKKIFFLEKMPKTIFSYMVPIEDSHILSESL